MRLSPYRLGDSVSDHKERRSPLQRQMICIHCLVIYCRSRTEAPPKNTKFTFFAASFFLLLSLLTKAPATDISRSPPGRSASRFLFLAISDLSYKEKAHHAISIWALAVVCVESIIIIISNTQAARS